MLYNVKRRKIEEKQENSQTGRLFVVNSFYVYNHKLIIYTKGKIFSKLSKFIEQLLIDNEIHDYSESYEPDGLMIITFESRNEIKIPECSKTITEKYLNDLIK
jgi:hypothetical protein